MYKIAVVYGSSVPTLSFIFFTAKASLVASLGAKLKTAADEAKNEETKDHTVSYTVLLR